MKDFMSNAGKIKNVNTPRSIKGLKEISSLYDVFLVDLYGVIYTHSGVCDGVFECLEHLSHEHKSVVFITNASVRSSHIVENLERIGISPSFFQHVFTAGEDAFIHLKNRSDPWYGRLGERCYSIGSTGAELLQDTPHHIVSSIRDAEYVLVAGSDEWRDPGEYKEILTQALRLHLPMVCANPNKNGLSPQAGDIAEKYELMGGKVRYHGKPYKDFFMSVLRHYPGVPKQRVLTIGDTLIIDIKGACDVGIDSVLVTEKKMDTYNKQGFAPTYTISGFIW